MDAWRTCESFRFLMRLRAPVSMNFWWRRCLYHSRQRFQAGTCAQGGAYSHKQWSTVIQIIVVNLGGVHEPLEGLYRTAALKAGDLAETVI